MQPRAGEYRLAAIDAQLDVRGGHVVEADRSKACVGVAARDREEGFAGEKRWHVDRFSRDGEDWHVGVALEDIFLAEPDWRAGHGACECL